jgi:hypothetical protein
MLFVQDVKKTVEVKSPYQEERAILMKLADRING